MPSCFEPVAGDGLVPASGAKLPGILNVDPVLRLDSNGLWRPTAGSPAIDGGAFVPDIIGDMDGLR